MLLHHPPKELFKWVLGDHAHVLVFAWQALYQLRGLHPKSFPINVQYKETPRSLMLAIHGLLENECLHNPMLSPVFHFLISCFSFSLHISNPDHSIAPQTRNNLPSSIGYPESTMVRHNYLLSWTLKSQLTLRSSHYRVREGLSTQKDKCGM